MKSLLGISLLALATASAQPFSFGIRGGTPFTGGLSSFTTQGVDVITHTFSNSNGYVIGAMAELHLPAGFGVEVDALYRPINLTIDNQVVPQTTIFQTSSNVSSWEFPLLGKFHFSFPVIKPYVDAGPAFRTLGNQLSLLSNKGFALGVGVEVKIHRIRIEPEVRYTHWGSDSVNDAILQNIASKTNQGEFTVGLSF